MKGDYLGAFEELVLLAVAAEGDEAYGITVRDRVERDSEREISLGAVYAALDRLESKRYVRSWIGDTGPYRGGRRKRHFALTKDGREVLRDMQRIRTRMWRAVESSDKRAT